MRLVRGCFFILFSTVLVAVYAQDAVQNLMRDSLPALVKLKAKEMDLSTLTDSVEMEKRLDDKNCSTGCGDTKTADEDLKDELSISVQCSVQFRDNREVEPRETTIEIPFTKINYSEELDLLPRRIENLTTIRQDEKDRLLERLKTATFEEKIKIYNEVTIISSNFSGSGISYYFPLIDILNDEKRTKLSSIYYNYLHSGSESERIVALSQMKNESNRDKVAFIGNYLSEYVYNYDMAEVSGIFSKRDVVTIEGQNKEIAGMGGGNGNSSGVCDMAHGTALLMARGMGLDGVILGYSTYDGGHTILRVDDIKNGKEYVINWGDVREHQRSLLPTSQLSVGLDTAKSGTLVNVFDVEPLTTDTGTILKMKQIGSYKLPLGLLLDDVSGIKSFYGDEDLSFNVVNKLRANIVQNRERGSITLFSGITSDGANVHGVAGTGGKGDMDMSLVFFKAVTDDLYSLPLRNKLDGIYYRIGSDSDISLFNSQPSHLKGDLQVGTRGNIFAGYGDISPKNSSNIRVAGGENIYYERRDDDSLVVLPLDANGKVSSGYLVDGSLTGRVGGKLEKKVTQKTSTSLSLGREFGVGVKNLIDPFAKGVFRIYGNRSDATAGVSRKDGHGILKDGEIKISYIVMPSIKSKMVKASAEAEFGTYDGKWNYKVGGKSYTSMTTGETVYETSAGVKYRCSNGKAFQGVDFSIKSKLSPQLSSGEVSVCVLIK